jgi:hypothetical protein
MTIELSPRRWFLATLAVAALVQASPCFATDDPLLAQFQNPPVSAKPQIWWHWMNGNITKEGITADLEAMHRVGISEANIITVASSIPPGPVPVMSPQFFDMVEFAAKEAKRLNMTLCMDNCPGWSCSGGPWVTPEHAMQMVTTSETTVDGPAPFSGKLTQPPAKKDFYRDIAVLAFKTPAGDSDLSTPANLPKITTSVPDLDVTSLLQPGSDKTVKLPKPVADHPVSVQIEYPQPVTARTLTIVPSGGFGANGKILTSSDGIHFDTVRSFNPPPDSAPISFSLGGHPVTARFFQVRFDQVNGRATGITLKGIEVSGGLRIDNISAKASFSADEVAPLEVAKSEQIAATPDLVVQSKEIVGLTSAMKPDGSLTWTVPAGRWTLLRVGYTITGKTNHPAPPEATGLDCDKLSPDGLDASWNGMMQPILNRLGPLTGKVLDHCLIDSYEMGGQNWTPRMVEDFKRLRGYDPTPFLPIMTGRVIDSSEISERFLWDERRTVADLFAQNYYGHFTELCHEHGLTSMIEPYVGPFESLQSGATNDIPMGEFWAGQDIDKKTECRSVKMASSIGHIYGQTVIAAESLTGYPTFGSWMDDPYSLKADGDRAFCRGINRFVFHRFAHQPWTDKYPGMTMGKWGINLDRTNTWWEMGKAWMQYITRSQFLLQQGRSVADIAYFCGQSTPVLIMAVDQGAPNGSVVFGSPEWRDLFKFSCQETARLGLSINMTNDAGWCGSGGPWITPALSMQKMVYTETSVQGPTHFEAPLPQPETVMGYYEDILLQAYPTPSGDFKINDLPAKTALEKWQSLPTSIVNPELPANQTIDPAKIVDLTARFKDGKLTWDVPVGNWTIVRYGHTTTGKDNHPAPVGGLGLETDKLSAHATEVMYDGLIKKLVGDIGPLTGKALVSTHIDSWETGSQNWSPGFREKFQQLRGYDPQPYWPVTTGRVVQSREISERFLWDLRQTVSDLLVKNYAGKMREMAEKDGLRLSIEGYDAPCDEMAYAGQSDEPMGELWSWPWGRDADQTTEMTSAAHIYGKRIVGLETFTANNKEKWLSYPGSVKSLGDWAFCEGINRFVFHRYAMQPWLDRKPGMSMGPWGLHYERTETWWEQSKPWHEYLARCQYLLQQGLFVADNREKDALYDEISILAHLYVEVLLTVVGQTVTLGDLRYKNPAFESHGKIHARIFPDYPGYTVHFLDLEGNYIDHILGGGE